MKSTILDLVKKGYSIRFAPDDFDDALFEITMSKRVKGDVLHHRVRILIEAVDLAAVDLIEVALQEQEKKISEKLQNEIKEGGRFDSCM